MIAKQIVTEMLKPGAQWRTVLKEPIVLLTLEGLQGRYPVYADNRTHRAILNK
jgi:hypothetical protein